MRPRSGKLEPIAVFVLSLTLYLANGRPLPEVDCVAAPYVAWSMLRHGSYDLRFYPELEPYVGGPVRVLASGAWVSMRPPGSALAVLPVIAPVALIRERPLRAWDMLHLGKLAAALSVAGAAVLFFLVCRRLAPSAVWPGTILFAWGTCLMSVASQASWMHGPATFWLCCALYLATRDDRERGAARFATGLALGLAVLTRPTTAFFAAATAVPLLTERRWRGLASLALGGAIPLLVLCHYNWVLFGHPILGGYEDDAWDVSPPLWLGLTGLLVAPSRGVLVYSPALVFAFVGVAALARRASGPWAPARKLLWAWLGAAVVTLVFFARWHDWRGGWCYGPRFLCETMPILCLLFAIGYGELRTRWQRSAALGLVALSVCIHLLGIVGYSGYEAWQQRHDLPDRGRSLFSLSDTQIEAHARAFLVRLRELLPISTRT